MTTQKDNRVIFVIPWRGYSLVGTTDLDDSENPDKVQPTEDEIQYLLKEASRVFPQAQWTREKVIAAFSGLRPLAWSDGSQASSVSREDKLLNNGNLLSIVGGKLTTYRSMAENALKNVFHILHRHPTGPLQVRLPGTPAIPWNTFLKSTIPRWVNAFGMEKNQALRLARVYGQKAEEVLQLMAGDSAWKEPLHPEWPEISAQVVYAVQKEKAVHLEDVLLRRLEIGYSSYRWGKASEKASRLRAQLLDWNEETRLAELERYRQQLFPRPETQK